ncbi:MAG: hypothetical protein HC810_07760 [Acaryochloridaceae cyanobacterium RL_2_7]|nr:hypothetical protein [Acaryochloridaceae cyanobacterium RL_2_7]
MTTVDLQFNHFLEPLLIRLRNLSQDEGLLGGMGNLSLGLATPLTLNLNSILLQKHPMLFKSENSRRKFTLIAGAIFAVGMGQSLLAVFTAPNQLSSAEATDQVPQEEVDLEAGYKIVLEREPENQTALQGLIQVQLANQKFTEAKPHIEKLIALNPENDGLRALLEEVNQQLAILEDQPSNSPASQK